MYVDTSKKTMLLWEVLENYLTPEELLTALIKAMGTDQAADLLDYIATTHDLYDEYVALAEEE